MPRGDVTPDDPASKSDAPSDTDATLGPDDVPAAQVAARSVPPVGAFVDRYRLLQELGRGASGVVFAAFDPKLDRKVALKVLRVPEGTGESSPGGRLVAEAKALAKLSHPNVVAVFDVGTTGSTPIDQRVYVAMELVPGRDLAAWIADVHMTAAWRRGRRWRDIVEVFLQAARGLAAAHEAGIVHRDFKPGNVLVGEDGRVRVVDFGLARAQVEPSDAPEEEGELDVATAHGGLQGTPAYLAPERIAGEEASAASDQYAFCIALFEALAGRRPFVAKSVPALLAEHLEGRIVWPADAPAIPPWLQRTVLRGLARDPRARWPSMHALIDALGRDPLGVARRVASWVGVTAGIGALAFGVWWLRQPGYVELVLSDRAGAPLPSGTVSIGERTFEIRAGVARGEVPAGKYTVTATAPDHRPAEAVLDVGRGSTHQLAMTLDHERAMLDLDVAPRGATIVVDGVDRGSRLHNLELDSGRHAIRAYVEGAFEARFEIELQADAHPRRFAYLPEVQAWREPETGAWGLLEWAGDLDGDGRSDVVHRNYGTVRADNPWTDTKLWSMEYSDSEAWAFALIDVDRDGSSELVTSVVSSSGDAHTVYDGTRVDGGKPRVRWRVEGRRKRVGEDLVRPMMPRAAEVGGRLSLLLSREERRIELRDAATGTARASGELDAAAVEARVVDGAAFVITTEGLEKWSLAGMSRAWATNLGAPEGNDRSTLQLFAAHEAEAGRSTLIAARLDDDEHVDALVPVPEGLNRFVLVAFDGRTGAERWRSPPARLSGSQFGRVPFDANGDGVDDPYVDTDKEAVLLDGRTGAPLWSRPGSGGNALQIAGERLLAVVRPDGVDLVDPATGVPSISIASPTDVEESPLLADMDADGEREIVFPANGAGLLTFALDGTPERAVHLRTHPRAFRPPADHDGDGLDDVLANANGPTVLRATNVRWAQVGNDAIRTTPVLADFDGNGSIEVAVVGAFADGPERALTIFDADSGLLLARGDTIEVIRDFDVVPGSDGGLDLLLQTTHDIRIVSGRDASVIAKTPTNRSYSSPGVGDWNGDGVRDVVVVPWDEDKPYVLLDADLRVVAEIAMPFGGSWVRPSFVDTDGVGGRELVGGYHDGHIAVIEVPGGAVRWSRSLGAVKVTHGPVPVDIDGDGSVELLVADTVGHALHCLAARDGATKWSAPDRGFVKANVVVADVDGDRDPEIATTSGATGVCLLDHAGRDLWCVDAPVKRSGAAVMVNALAIAPLGDRPSVLATFEDGTLAVLDAASGDQRWTYTPPEGERYDTRPAIADVDGDGTPEVFLAGWDRTLRSLRVPTRSR